MVKYTDPRQLIGKEMYGYNPVAGEQAFGEALLRGIFGDIDRKRAEQGAIAQAMLEQRMKQRPERLYNVLDPISGKMIENIPSDLSGFYGILYNQKYAMERAEEERKGRMEYEKQRQVNRLELNQARNRDKFLFYDFTKSDKELQNLLSAYRYAKDSFTPEGQEQANSIWDNIVNRLNQKYPNVQIDKYMVEELEQEKPNWFTNMLSKIGVGKKEPQVKPQAKPQKSNIKSKYGLD